MISQRVFGMFVQRSQDIDAFQAGIICATFINHYLARQLIMIYGLFKEGPSSDLIPVLGQHEVNGAAVFIDGSI
jgi:hypothetical protein